MVIMDVTSLDTEEDDHYDEENNERIKTLLIKTPHGVENVDFDAAEIFVSFEPDTPDVGEAPDLNREISKKLNGSDGQGAFDFKQHTVIYMQRITIRIRITWSNENIIT